jgi:predicted phosphohydrolase
MIALQNPDVKIMKQNSDGTETIDAYPRIILTNSHDGFNSFKFMLGMYRILCSNGLCICDEEYENFSIRHINYTFDELRLIVKKSIEKVPNVVCTMNKMKSTTASEEQKREIATEVIRIRKDADDEQKFDIDEETIMEILNPVREEDRGDDLWTVFNVCQEKLIKGGFMAIGNNKKVRKQRSITSIKKDLDYNQRLWAFATKYIA